MAKTVYFYSGFWSFSAEDFNKSLDDAQGDDVTIRVNSYGGDVFAGFGMATRLREFEGKVTMKVDGLAASMGAAILPFADTVEMSEFAKIMIHKAAGSTENESDRKLLDQVNVDLRSALESKIDVERFAKVTGFSMDDVFKGDKRIDVWLTAKEAKSVGLVDSITSLSKKDKTTAELQINTIAATLGYTPPTFEATHTEKEIKNKSNTTIMTIEKIKAENRAIYDQIVQIGVTAEKDRVGAFMAYSNVDLEAVKKGIDGGEPLTQTAQAEFNVKIAQNGVMAALKNDSAEDLNPKGKGEEGKDPKEVEAKAEAVKFEASLDEHIEKNTNK